MLSLQSETEQSEKKQKKQMTEKVCLLLSANNRADK